MRFLTYVQTTEHFHRSAQPPALEEAGRRLMDDLVKRGVVIEGGTLHHSRHATHVSVANGEVIVTDGPFTESKEVVGGFAILELPSREAAIQVEKEFLELYARHWPEWKGTGVVRQMVGPGENWREV